MSYMVFGPFGGEGKKYQRFDRINGIEALYTTGLIKSIKFSVSDNTSKIVQTGRDDGKTPYKVKLEEGERITQFFGYFHERNDGGSQEKVITSLTFETDKNRILGPIGTKRGKPFSVLSADGESIEIFVGVTEEGDCVTSIGAGAKVKSVKENLVKSIGPFGGADPWDDGIFKGVKEIYLHLTIDKVISYISFVYDFNGQAVVNFMHPEGARRQGDEIKVPYKYPREYLTSISGHTAGDGSIQALEFYTNMKSYKYGKTSGGTYFWYPSTGANKIVGFHGTSGKTINSIGVHMKPISSPPSPKPSIPLTSGKGSWDDGERSHVIGYRVTASADGKRIESITFIYDDNGSSFKGPRHGRIDTKYPGVWIMLNFPEERLVSLTGSLGKEDGCTIIHNLELRTTSTTRPTRVYANKFDAVKLEESKFEKFKKSTKSKPNEILKKEEELKKSKKELEKSKRFQIPKESDTGKRISGFFGMANSSCLNSIGAYVGSY